VLAIYFALVDGMVAAVRAGRPVAEVMHDKEFESIRSN
jgi:4-hydroxy-4-methyl-2-oxoglutarate aldolase